MRYNGFLAADINGGAAPGYSSGQAQAAVARVAAQTLPPGIGYEWTELTYQEILAGNSGSWVFPIAICWCSWCWRRSTKAWRCRWPSS
jgi:multidrug efflux pump